MSLEVIELEEPRFSRAHKMDSADEVLNYHARDKPHIDWLPALVVHGIDTTYYDISSALCQSKSHGNVLKYTSKPLLSLLVNTLCITSSFD